MAKGKPISRGMNDEEKAAKATELLEEAIALVDQLDSDVDDSVGDIQSELTSIKTLIEMLSFNDDGALISGEDDEPPDDIDEDEEDVFDEDDVEDDKF